MLPHPPAGWHEAVPVVLYAIETADLRVKIGEPHLTAMAAWLAVMSDKTEAVVHAFGARCKQRAVTGRHSVRGPS